MLITLNNLKEIKIQMRYHRLKLANTKRYFRSIFKHYMNKRRAIWNSKRINHSLRMTS